MTVDQTTRDALEEARRLLWAAHAEAIRTTEAPNAAERLARSRALAEALDAHIAEVVS